MDEIEFVDYNIPHRDPMRDTINTIIERKGFDFQVTRAEEALRISGRTRSQTVCISFFLGIMCATVFLVRADRAVDQVAGSNGMPWRGRRLRTRRGENLSNPFRPLIQTLTMKLPAEFRMQLCLPPYRPSPSFLSERAPPYHNA